MLTEEQGTKNLHRGETAKAVPIFITAPLFRHWHLRWVATDQEITGPMPGDELVPVSHFTATLKAWGWS